VQAKDPTKSSVPNITDDGKLNNKPTTEQNTMTDNPNQSIRNHVGDAAIAATEPRNAAAGEHTIPVDEDVAIEVDDDELQCETLPYDVHLAQEIRPLNLDGESPFTREAWLKILSKPQVTILEDSKFNRPFVSDFEHLYRTDDDVFHRSSQASELSSDFWLWAKDQKRDVRAVVVKARCDTMNTYFVSLPAGMPLSEGFKYLQVHAATQHILLECQI
jgi:hypothetical protein